MIPIQDVVPTSRLPVVTLTLVGLNIAAFVYQLAAPVAGAHPIALSLFAHSGFPHFVFNVLFLWLFGDNVEDRLGRGTLVFCYVACGALAAMIELTLTGTHAFPPVAATAAIAAVIGAYFVLLPHSKVLMFVPVPPALVEVPALFFLAMFWVLQFLNFVVLPAATGSDSAPAAVLTSLTVAFGSGALISAVLRRPVRW